MEGITQNAERAGIIRAAIWSIITNLRPPGLQAVGPEWAAAAEASDLGAQAIAAIFDIRDVLTRLTSAEERIATALEVSAGLRTSSGRVMDSGELVDELAKRSSEVDAPPAPRLVTCRAARREACFYPACGCE